MVSLQFSPFDPFQSFLTCILLSLLCTVKYYLPYKCDIFLPSLGQAVLCMVFPIINPATLCVSHWQTAIADPAPFSYLSYSSGCFLPLVSLFWRILPSSSTTRCTRFTSYRIHPHSLWLPPEFSINTIQNKKNLHCTFTAVYNLQEEAR